MIAVEKIIHNFNLLRESGSTQVSPLSLGKTFKFATDKDQHEFYACVDAFVDLGLVKEATVNGETVFWISSIAIHLKNLDAYLPRISLKLLKSIKSQAKDAQQVGMPTELLTEETFIPMLITQRSETPIKEEKSKAPDTPSVSPMSVLFAYDSLGRLTISDSGYQSIVLDCDQTRYLQNFIKQCIH